MAEGGERAKGGKRNGRGRERVGEERKVVKIQPWFRSFVNSYSPAQNNVAIFPVVSPT